MLQNVLRKARAISDMPVQWLVIIISLLVAVALSVDSVNLEEVYATMTAWIFDQHDWHIITFTVVCAVLMSIIIPELILGVAAGNLFGFVWGSISFCISGMLCSFLVFLVARTLLQAPVQAALSRHPKLHAIEDVVNDGGLRLLCLLRLLPLNPALMSYALATTKISLWPYLIASLCMIPSWVLTVYFGHVATSVARIAGDASEYMPLEDSLTIGGLLLSVAIMIYIARIAAKQCVANGRSK